MNGGGREVVIIDLGVGNLGNLARALRHLGADVVVTADPATIAGARTLLLPGVGAYRPAREALRGPLEAALRRAVAEGAWLLGICLGYQLLFDGSDEFGSTDGLGLLPGRVVALPTTVPRPHIGWNRLLLPPADQRHALFDGAEAEGYSYFVHSFAPDNVPDELVLARCQHGRSFAAAAGRGRVLGVQFHPEKSGDTGLAILRRFLALADHATDLLPAIDLRHGRVVRLTHGDAARETSYGDDPVAVARGYAAAGARWLHLVDLDAAFGEPPQRETVGAVIAAARAAGLRVEVGGGFRDATSAAAVLDAGAERVIVGSLVVRDPAAFADLCRRFPGRVVPAVEVRDGEVRVAGWREGSGRSVAAVAAGLRGLGCPAVLVTDVGRDGTLAGPNCELAVAVARAAEIPALLSGGVATLADLATARGVPEIGGVIVGRALYEGAFTVAAGLAVLAGGPAERVAWPVDTAPVAGPATGLARRVIPCLDVAAGRVVKGVRFVELVDHGDPAAQAARYAAEGADEIVFLDITAAVDGRGTDLGWVERTAAQVFVPLTVGGGVRSVEDARRLLLAGADKVGVNSAAVLRPELLTELAERFGRQCVVLAVDARRRAAGAEHDWEVVIHGGRTPTGHDALAWIAAAVALGAGEILLTSIDADGTQAGYDLELLRAAVAVADGVPVIASGGVGSRAHLAAGLAAGAAAVLAASIFHQRLETVAGVKEALAAGGFPMRPSVPEPVTAVAAAGEHA